MKLKKAKNKNEARQIGIEFQQWASEQNLSYGELANYQGQLYNMAKRFGLVREFRENGVI